MNGLSPDEQLTANALWAAIINVDLQLYKASMYKLRWGSPGGLDHALPAYAEAKRTVDSVDWPERLRAPAKELGERIAAHMATLEEQDVTSASAQHSYLIRVFEELRERVRQWPKPVAEARVPEYAEDREPGVPGHMDFYEDRDE